MKNLLIALLLMFSASCATQKHKSKQANQSEAKKMETTSTDRRTDLETAQAVTRTDSAAQKTDLVRNMEVSSILQNLTLKNSGKCAEGGEIRFLKFTDAQGNTTEVPVNDNTELDFSAGAHLQKENIQLKAELQKSQNINEQLNARLQVADQQNRQNREEFSTSSKATDLDVERNSFMSYVWTVLIAVLLWEIGKFTIKKLI
ncbi:hypothetical protein [Chryseobacterium sp. MFBS3-17]|uniref:hypothetical protein n=1 Tax=Chryseobacterium sp. MFBS3-17 TaxID=2886689 RepID=UPI001D0DD77F|nr:hypothetical protein [Chryseobacterium sp. MFBS3-17]MCC2590374.1 hypothetical protein [Chryseobacterium sp. MFBS3-17]